MQKCNFSNSALHKQKHKKSVKMIHAYCERANKI